MQQRTFENINDQLQNLSSFCHTVVNIAKDSSYFFTLLFLMCKRFLKYQSLSKLQNTFNYIYNHQEVFNASQKLFKSWNEKLIFCFDLSCTPLASTFQLYHSVSWELPVIQVHLSWHQPVSCNAYQRNTTYT